MVIYCHNKEGRSRSPHQRLVKWAIVIMLIIEVRAFCVRTLFIIFTGVLFISRETQQINGEIRDKELRVISADGEQLGIMSAAEALKIAEDQDLDLVKIAPQAKPPVCKIMDYSKYRYEKAKREKENRKNQKQIEMKEIRLSVTIDVGDFNTKVNQAKKFLASGHKLKISIRLKGRMMTHSDLGIENMKRFAASLEEEANVDKAPKLEGRQILMFLSPKQSK